MSTPGRRPRRGLEAVASATLEAPAAVHLVLVDGIPRAFLKPAEFAAICGMPNTTLVYRLIAQGVVHTVQELGTAHHAIPTSEIARLQNLARQVPA